MIPKHWAWFLLSGLSLWAAKPEVAWMDFASALKRAHSDSLFVFVDVYAASCVPCREMESTTFRDSAVVAMLNQKFYSTRLDAMSDVLINCNNWPQATNKCIMNTWQIQGVPSFALLGPSGNLLVKITDYQSPEQMRVLLQSFLESRKILLELDKKPKGDNESP